MKKTILNVLADLAKEARDMIGEENYCPNEQALSYWKERTEEEVDRDSEYGVTFEDYEWACSRILND